MASQRPNDAIFFGSVLRPTHGNQHGTTTQLWGAKTKHCCVAVPVKTTTLPNLDSENRRALDTNGIHLQR
jgi:hypothetical protein